MVNSKIARRIGHRAKPHENPRIGEDCQAHAPYLAIFESFWQCLESAAASDEGVT
jgi:hypothetical protein